MTIFQPLENLAELSDEALGERLAEFESLADRVAEGDAELVGELSAAEVIAELEAGVDAIEAMRAEITARAELDAENQTKLAELRKRAKGETDEEPEAAEEPVAEAEEAEEPAEAEEVVVEEKVAVTAAAPVRRRSLPRPTGDHAPKPKDGETDGERVAITASAVDGEAGFDRGAVLTAEDIARAMVKRHDSFGRGILDDRGQKVPVARLSSNYGESRHLSQNPAENRQKILDVTSPKALAASGGICAPVTPYYGLLELAVPDRPVKNCLPSFNADRGGIRYAIPPTMADITDAVGIVTAAQDAAGGSAAVKSCQHIECPDIAEVDVSIIYHCVEFGNLQARTFPEQVAQFNELVMAAFARKAEVNLLDGIAGASIDVTATQVAGTVSTLLGQIITAAAGYRSRNRMNVDTPLRVLLPAWVLDAMQVDVLRSQFMRFDSGDATFTGELAKANVNACYYMDSPTGLGQNFGAQNAGALLPFPDHAVWFMFAEGSFLFLDGGVLELGIVRDSTLNSTNDYQIFGEAFENLAYLGIESLQVASPICTNGQVSAPVDVVGCAA